MAVTTTYGFVSLEDLDESGIDADTAATSLTGGGIAISGDRFDNAANSDLTVFNADGDVTGGTVLTNTGTQTSIAQLSNGNVVVLADRGADMVFNVRTLAGGPVVGPTAIPDPGGTSSGDVAGLAGGGFVVALQKQQSGDDSDINVYRYANDGGPLGAFIIDASTIVDGRPSVAALADGGFTIAWVREAGSPGDPGYTQQVWYAVYNADGSEQLAPTLITYDGDDPNPDVVRLGAGFAIAYEVDGGADTDIGLAIFNAAGDELVRTDVSQNAFNDFSPSLTVLSNGMIAMGSLNAEYPDDDPTWTLINPVTGFRLASSTVGANQSHETEVSVAAMGLGQLGAFFTRGGEVIGQRLQAQRFSTGNAADDVIVGDDLVDVVEGGGGADTLRGGANADELSGGAGADTFEYATGEATAGEFINGGTSFADVDRILTLSTVDLTGATILAIEEIEFGSPSSSFAPRQVIVSAAQLNLGFAADLFVDGAVFAFYREELVVRMLAETQVSAAGFTFAEWDAGDAVVFVGDGDAETITGSSQSDRFLGGGGADTLDGGAASDTVDFSDKAAGVALTLSGATVQTANVGGAAEDTVRNIESVIGGSGDDALTGDGLVNALTGGGGADTLRGGGAADQLFGGAGNDSFLYATGEASLGETINGGTNFDRILASDSVDLTGATLTAVEEIEFTSPFASFAPRLMTIRADQIGAGGLAANLLLDGTSLPAFYREELEVRMLADTSVSAAAFTFEGWDAIDAIVFVGDADAETITGSSQSDRFLAGGGADTLDGGAGADTVDFSDKVAAVVLTLAGATIQTATVGGVLEDTVRNIENVIGGTGADTLTGDGLANRLLGGAGSDRLRGGAGNDSFDGGTGVGDAVDFLDKSGAVTLTLAGSAEVIAFIAGGEQDTVRNVEHVYSGSGADVITGGAGVNHIYGGGGGDLIRGGLGADLLVGGTDIDTLDYRDKATAVVLTLAGRTNVAVAVNGVAEDTVREFEQVFGGTAADTLTGDSAANLFRGGGGADVINGFGGADTIDFRDKTVGVLLTLAGGANAIASVGGTAEDTVRNVENVMGGTANDTLHGDVLVNRLTGGGGGDELRGGGGGDTFAYLAVTDSTAGAAGRDRIIDFSAGQGDQIDLSAIDAITGGSDDAFVLGAMGTAGRLQISTIAAGAAYLVEVDVNGGGADFAIAVNATTAPVAADFVL